jgi:LysM repeat protein
MRFSTAAFALAACASSAIAHMEMKDPPPLRSQFNKNTPQSKVDFDMNAPLKGLNEFPCKGFLGDLKLSPDGDSVAEWAAGSSQTTTIVDKAFHDGGSCQLSISYDQGQTFRVIKSFEGNCPTEGSDTLDFTVPADAKAGKAVFGWTWFNHTGNREMYMNCAVVTITGTGTSTLDDRPKIFVANIVPDCTVLEGTDVEFPDPGPDVVRAGTSLGPPQGPGCGSSNTNPAPGKDAPLPQSDPANSTDSQPDPANPTDSTDTGVSSSYESTTAAVAPTDGPKPQPSPSASSPPASTPTSPTSDVGTTYTVKSGDICIDIAAQNNLPLSKIFDLNPSINPNCTNLEPGQEIKIRRRSRIMRDLH